MLEPDPNSG